VAAFEAWLYSLILVVNVVGELQRKRTLAASRGFLAAERLSCLMRVMTHSGSVNEYQRKLGSKRHTTRCTGPVSVVLRLRLVSG